MRDPLLLGLMIGVKNMPLVFIKNLEYIMARQTQLSYLIAFILQYFHHHNGLLAAGCHRMLYQVLREHDSRQVIPSIFPGQVGQKIVVNGIIRIAMVKLAHDHLIHQKHFFPRIRRHLLCGRTAIDIVVQQGYRI